MRSHRPMPPVSGRRSSPESPIRARTLRARCAAPTTSRRGPDRAQPWRRRPRHADGGAAAFREFLARLKPARASLSCTIDPTRQALFGHSLARLFVLHTLVTRPRRFRPTSRSARRSGGTRGLVGGGVASSPDRRAASRSHRRDDHRRRVRTGARALAGRAAEAADQRPARGSAHGRRRARPRRRARASGIATGRRFEELAGEDHASVVPAAMSRGCGSLCARIQRDSAGSRT